MVDIKGQNRSLLDLRTAGFEDSEIPWQSGLSQTSGMRNKLSVSIVNRPKFNEGQEGLFALFDGGRNDEVTRILSSRITAVLEEEIKHSGIGQDYLKYTMLAAHRKLKFTGQKVGAAGAICHLCKPKESNHYVLNVANVGDVEVVVCRRGEAVVQTKLFTVSNNKVEMERICKSGGIVTEDNKINGVTQNTRLLGSSYLFPFVIPDPHVTTTTLQPDDQLVIIANQGLWKYMSYQETVNEIINIPDPVLAAKKLQDLAQGYNSQENIGVLVVRLMLSHEERNKMREMFHHQFKIEQKLLAELRVRDIDREEKKKRAELEELNETVPMDIVKLKHAKKRKQIDGVFSDINRNGEFGGDDIDDLDGVKIKPLPRKHRHSDNTDPTSNWEIMLQKRLTEEVKDKELIHAMRVQHEHDPYFPTIEADNNWSTTTKLKGQVKERTVTLPPDDYLNLDPPAPHKHGFVDDSQISTESLYFKRELKHPLNVDRDAILFHNMQLSRQKSHHLSSRSIDSIQSDPAFASAKEMAKEKKSSSHSIEVLLHGPTAHHVKNKCFGGSDKFPKHEVEMSQRNSKGDSCPSEMTDRLKMLEEKGFLPHETDHEENAKVDKRITAEEAENQYADRLDLSGGESTDTLSEIHQVMVSTDTLTDGNVTNVTDDIEEFQNGIADYETIGAISAAIQRDESKSVEKDNVNVGDCDSANTADTKEIHSDGYLQWMNGSKGRKSNSAEMLPEKTVDEDENLTELYATVKKVRKVHNQNVQHDNSETKDIPKETAKKVSEGGKHIKNDADKAVSEIDNSRVQDVKLNGNVNGKEKVMSNINTSIHSNTDYSSIQPVNSFHPSKSLVNKIDTVKLEQSPSTVKTSGSPVVNFPVKYDTEVPVNTPSYSSHAPSEQQQKESETGMCKSPEPKFPFKKRPAPKVDESRRSKSPVSYYQGKSNFVQQQSQKFIQEQIQAATKSNEEPMRSRSPGIYGNTGAYKRNGENPIQTRAMNYSPNTTVQVGKSLIADQSRRSRSKSPVSFRGNNQLPDVVKHSDPQTSQSPYQGKISVIDTGTDVRNVSFEHKKRAPPPVPPRVPLKQFSPQSDINSNSLKSLEDLIAYNRLQQQKVSYKVTPKAAPTPPPKVPETSMITKTASQRSVIITYL